MAKSIKTKLFTSIAPTNIERQKTCINSWVDKGYQVYSFNIKEEIEFLASYFNNVKFIEVKQTAKHYFGKPYPIITDMILNARELSDDVILINSDIELNNYIDFTKFKYSAVFNRFNYDIDVYKDEAVVYPNGFDLFFIKKDDIDFIPPSLLCIGQCFWDYMIPYRLVIAGRVVLLVQDKNVLHKNHKLNYSEENYLRSLILFRAEVPQAKFNETNSQFNIRIFNTIKHSLKAWQQ